MEIKFINKSKNPLPSYKTEGSSGFDIKANLVDGSVSIKPLERKLIPTGLYPQIPYGYEMQIRPRSGLSLNHGITVLNTPGTIDSDYRGEIMCIMINLSDEIYTINHGDRISQGVIAPVIGSKSIELKEIDQLDDTIRGEGGFGHTGI